MRTALLTLAFVMAATADGHDPIRFIHPKRTVVIGSPRGVVIPVQTLITPHADNRAFVLVWRGENCEGSSEKSLDGEYDRGLQPIEPIKVRVGYGVCAFRAAVFGPNSRIREQATLEVRVCGGDEPCS